MKINIASSHRFHLLDLAVQLEKQGYDVRFYSYVPNRKCISYGLGKNSSSMIYIALPFLLLMKLLPVKCANTIVRMRNKVMDWYIGNFMRPCDVYIALGSVYVNSIQRAKQKGITTILEWGSKHIIDQLTLFGKLDMYSKKQLVDDIRSYNIADYIAIPATHVKESFIRHGIDSQKLLVNPYGVSLDQFYPTVCSNEFELIAVGGWRYEKGSDLLVEVCKKYGYKLLHVGALVNMDFPKIENMEHVDPVPQHELLEYYKKAKVFVLPSRAEGLSLVQAQAIACGLPIVCSKETGGSDLRELLDDKKWIVEMKDISVDYLHDAIESALSLVSKQEPLERDYSKHCIRNLSWDAYGERYSNNIINLMKLKQYGW